MKRQSQSERRVVAFSPAHSTGFFSPVFTSDPSTSGSLGCGITLSCGVKAFVSAAEGSDALVDAVYVEDSGEAGQSGRGAPIETPIESVGRVLDLLYNEMGTHATPPERPSVHLEVGAPLGCGLGMSGASALSTSLAISAYIDKTLPFNRAADIAHIAEVESGTGLGDVVGQSVGGVVIRKSAGAPSKASTDKIDPSSVHSQVVSYVVGGAISTHDVLSSMDISAVASAGKYCLKELIRNPTLESFFELSREFAQRTGLLSEWAESVLEALDSEGKQGFMSMLGDCVVCLGESEILTDLLSEFGYVRRCTITSRGAHLIDTP